MNCCIEIVNGAPAGGAALASGWQCVYEVDWRDAFTAVGAVDLAIVGSSITYQGVDWETPTIANSGINQIAPTTWALTAAGLTGTVILGGSIVASGPSFPHIFANLRDVALNTATPFDGDPTRKYLLQCYVSQITTVIDQNEAGIGLYHVDGVPSGGFSTSYCTFGRNAGSAEVPSYTAGSGGAPPRQTRTDLAGSNPLMNCPTLMYGGSGKIIDGYAGAFAGDWPANNTLRLIAPYAQPDELEADTPGDPFSGFQIVMGASALGTSAWNIEQFRICQL